MSDAHTAVHGGHHPVDPSVPVEYHHEENSLRIAGFWVFLGSDLVLFSCLFATYVVMHGRTAGGPTSNQLFDVTGFTIETIALLFSSFTCGLATYEMRRGNRNAMVMWLLITIALGLVFLGFEITEFVQDASSGARMQTSGFLSAFFTLVGTHGCHVSMGILWMSGVVVQLIRRGITPITARKAFIVSIYWHFLDAVWIFIFTVVYLTGKVL
ncbi:cytochrome aa3 quinol oxidase subunit III [Alicyclobacillus acidoterrestris]|uniref:Quinol oxidase subunit 3 n=1 Tax=Alicyclobacillus acidoterrestris (strain ATCC 49025 / DSM 3922 / CIP 106132 / NCIMB 13137 / GD3B) TaxID=1356854 RepID=T0BQQ4_ALIAG|nr:cytochrome aa3 quinol oxidase subunit III [Alicyclobacillus acidoterrestris]EPZ43049.1 cytochrome O ubiquinol oxidase [Alicyclobacillus acidoterrestris ATCC 49025]UNO49841.1 cytochrome aa3 quinol oxidase subunit III [Alicyclobacillus acidoterrestris]GEO26087.1 cytochrome aa3 quinol oxidase subunit III [Alicyclobacillus acidoterrestris]